MLLNFKYINIYINILYSGITRPMAANTRLCPLWFSTNSLYSPQTYMLPGCIAQSVTCLATDACLAADQKVASSIPVRYHTFVEIDHEMISTVILLPSPDSFKKGCCQLQAKVCARITG